MSFPNINVYITGGSSGIGFSAAKKLAEKGANILIFARRRDLLEKAVDEIKNHKKTDNQQIMFRELDISDHLKVAEVMNQAVSEFGVPDILINSAGISNPDYFENITYETFDRII